MAGLYVAVSHRLCQVDLANASASDRGPKVSNPLSNFFVDVSHGAGAMYPIAGYHYPFSVDKDIASAYPMLPTSGYNNPIKGNTGLAVLGKEPSLRVGRGLWRAVAREAH